MEGKPTTTLEIYDPVQGTWSKGSPLPEARSRYSLVAFEGRMYLFGGWDGSQIRNEVFVYDAQADNWEMRTPMRTARAFSGAVALDGRIYVVGGEDNTGPLNVNEVYTPANENNQPWKSAASLPTARSRAGIGTAANYVQLFGGTPEAQPISYDIRTDTWQQAQGESQLLGNQPGVAQRDGVYYILSGTPGQSVTSLFEVRQTYTLVVPLR